VLTPGKPHETHHIIHRRRRRSSRLLPTPTQQCVVTQPVAVTTTSLVLPAWRRPQAAHRQRRECRVGPEWPVAHERRRRGCRWSGAQVDIHGRPRTLQRIQELAEQQEGPANERTQVVGPRNGTATTATPSAVTRHSKHAMKQTPSNHHNLCHIHFMAHGTHSLTAW
jgi:hypothetical protein